MEVLTYVPSNVILAIGGYQVEGWTEISVAQNTPSFTQIRGIRGKNTRTRNRDTSAVISIRVHQTSLVNDVLSEVLRVDMAQGTGRLEILLAEVTGTSLFSTRTGYILNTPEFKRGSELNEVTWIIGCDESNLSVGSAKNAAIGIVENSVARLKDFVQNTVN